MPKVELFICDVCKVEKRSDQKQGHWTEGWGHGCTVDFKAVPNIQQKYVFEAICPACASAVIKAVNEAVKRRSAAPDDSSDRVQK